MPEIAHARPWESGSGSGNVDDGDIIATSVPGRGEPSSLQATISLDEVIVRVWKFGRSESTP